MKEALHSGDYQMACSMAKEVLDKEEGNNEDRSLAIHVLARTLQRLGEYEEAIPYAQQEVELSKHPVDRAQNLINLADIYFEANQEPLGYSNLQKGFHILKEMKLEHTPYFIPFWITMGRMYRIKRQWKEAIHCIDHALSILKENRGRCSPKNPAYYTMLMDKGYCYYQQKKNKEAFGLLWESREGFLDLYGENHPSYSNACLTLANVYCAEKNYSAALPLYREGFAIYRRVWGPDSDRTKQVHRVGSLCEHQLRSSLKEAKQGTRIPDWTVCKTDRIIYEETGSCFN